MSVNIYYVVGALLVIYLLISISNKKSSRKRRSRKFMEGYERKDRRTAGKENEEGKD